MPVSISVKNVPDDMIDRLRRMAKRHHRSLQGELMAILEEATGPSKLSLDEADVLIKGYAFKTGDEATGWLRELRDAR